MHYESEKLNQSPDEFDFPRTEYRPFGQVSIWKFPCSKLLYYPDEVRYASGAEMDKILNETLRAHLSRVKPVPPQGKKEFDDDVRSNLADI